MRLVERPSGFSNPVVAHGDVLQTVQAVPTGIVADRLWESPVWSSQSSSTSSCSSSWPNRCRDVGRIARRAGCADHRASRVGARAVLAVGDHQPRLTDDHGSCQERTAPGPLRLRAGVAGIVQHAASEDVIEHGERELIESVIDRRHDRARSDGSPHRHGDRRTRVHITQAMDVAIGRGFHGFLSSETTSTTSSAWRTSRT